jgi:uncharacterized membrane protein
MSIYLKYLSVILASSLKFVGGPLTGFAMGLHWTETAACTASGMMIAVILFLYLGNFIQQLISKYRRQPPKRFSSQTRYAVKIWQRFGITGIAFLTPILFTPIGGTLVAISFKVKKLKVIYSMSVSAICWAVVQSLFLFYLSELKSFF